jgi:TRAP-type C4-dicarboxylate transport system substrate-binding protein
VYSALQQRVIDAQENPVAVIYSSKIYEVRNT